MADINEEIKEEIHNLREEVTNISAKVDQVLKMLSDFTIMLMEDPEDEEDNEDEEYGYEDSWLPKDDDFWENDEE